METVYIFSHFFGKISKIAFLGRTVTFVATVLVCTFSSKYTSQILFRLLVCVSCSDHENMIRLKSSEKNEILNWNYLANSCI